MAKLRQLLRSGLVSKYVCGARNTMCCGITKYSTFYSPFLIARKHFTGFISFHLTGKKMWVSNTKQY